MFSAAGFDAQRDIAGIILNRWGHAYLSPQPGFLRLKADPRRERSYAANPSANRIRQQRFAGAMDHRYSILEAKRAVSLLCDQVLLS